jgi:hypothetical protein
LPGSAVLARSIVLADSIVLAGSAALADRSRGPLGFRIRQAQRSSRSVFAFANRSSRRLRDPELNTRFAISGSQIATFVALGCMRSTSLACRTHT